MACEGTLFAGGGATYGLKDACDAEVSNEVLEVGLDAPILGGNNAKWRRQLTQEEVASQEFKVQLKEFLKRQNPAKYDLAAPPPKKHAPAAETKGGRGAGARGESTIILSARRGGHASCIAVLWTQRNTEPPCIHAYEDLLCLFWRGTVALLSSVILYLARSSQRAASRPPGAAEVLMSGLPLGRPGEEDRAATAARARGTSLRKKTTTGREPTRRGRRVWKPRRTPPFLSYLEADR